ncbi:magnesium-dependent phosphatase 1-like [Vigna radiata var. radiata]|uniref:Magnesium-dependent phosphatase 1-like n=1 Tax=Vigna radiata var. radiata TaxID=3916 RepID=A0A3Q0EKB9_VIGRR|nr:magnesium-dependent phosphatase 1-like [Vigna radiata var. radiata]
MEEKPENVKGEALQIIEAFEILPKLVVFDLEYSFWPFCYECQSKREMCSLYPHAKGILLGLKEKGIAVAIASRTGQFLCLSCFSNSKLCGSLFSKNTGN